MQSQLPYHIRLAEYERRKRDLQKQGMPPADYEKAIDELCKELGI